MLHLQVLALEAAQVYACPWSLNLHVGPYWHPSKLSSSSGPSIWSPIFLWWLSMEDVGLQLDILWESVLTFICRSFPLGRKALEAISGLQRHLWERLDFHEAERLPSNADTGCNHSDPDTSTTYALGMASRQGESAAASDSPSTPGDVWQPWLYTSPVSKYNALQLNFYEWP